MTNITRKEALDKYIGKHGTIALDKLVIEVEILDFKNSYGNNRFLVAPVSGSGQSWVENVKIK